MRCKEVKRIFRHFTNVKTAPMKLLMRNLEKVPEGSEALLRINVCNKSGDYGKIEHMHASHNFWHLVTRVHDRKGWP